jgi:hypothetical protein
MRRFLPVLLLLVATSAVADELTASAVITAFRLGATPEAMIAHINNPVNTVAPVTETDLANLKAAGVPDSVVQALVAKAPTPTSTPGQPKPDDPRLVNLVRMVKSGLSEPIVLEQIKRSGENFQLTPNDVVYLKAEGVPESVITFLVTNKSVPPVTSPTAVAAAPAVTPAPTVAPTATPTPEPQEMTIEGVVLKKPTFLRKNRSGRLVFNGDEVQWIDAVDPKESFSFQMSGVEKVWFSCQARPSESFCYQLNIQIVRGARYRFQDVKRETGSNEAVTKAEAWIKKHFPTVSWAPPDVDS